MGHLNCNFRGGAVSGDDRVQGVALVAGGRAVKEPRPQGVGGSRAHAQVFISKGGTLIKCGHM